MKGTKQATWGFPAMRLLSLVVTLVALAATLLVALPIAKVQASEVGRLLAQEVGTNLLANPGFEGIGLPYNNGQPNPNNWTRDNHAGVPYGEVYTPEGWVTWWQEGDFKRPECKVIPNEHPFSADPKRVYEGYYSGMCFTFYGKQNAGYYQVVRNIPPGSVVEGSFYAHAWSCPDDNPPLSCGDPNSFYFRVGIDPNGGNDPFSSGIVWSNAYFNYDEFSIVGPVQATVGESGAATLFIQSYGKWPNKHNDAYYDNAALRLVSTGETPTPTAPPPPPTSDAPPPTVGPRVTPTPLPNGAIVHIIESGDTLFALALAYDVPIDQIYELNDIGPSDLLQIGQEIVIAIEGGAAPAAPTATPTPAAEQTAEAETPEAEQPGDATSPTGPTVPQDQAAVCVLAFNDANSDFFRQADAGEMLLPNAEVNLLGTGGPVDTRITDGISEPWCFDGLAPGNYILRHTPPPGYKHTDGGQMNFSLGGGQVLNVELAYVRDGEAPAPTAGGEGSAQAPGDIEVVEEGEEAEGGSGVTNFLNVVLRVSGFIVLALAIALLVLFFISRRAA